MLEIGSILDGKYKILNQIGKGGMSVVYLAMNEKANKQWAVKEVRKDGVQDFEVVKQGLIVETDMLKKLRHPYLPSIVDVIEEEGRFLIVMDYIEGNPLSLAVQEYGPQPQEYVIEWAKQLCEVLGYLHSRKPSIIYRDLKPGNIMLKPDGSITLIDFGTAREYKRNVGQDTRYLGTQGYAAPEQFGGLGQTDVRTDIYCLGATLYHLVTGHNPSEPPYEMYPIRYWNPLLSQGLEQIIWKCIQRNPNDRYQSCAEVYYALEHYMELDRKHINIQKGKLTAFVTTLAIGISGIMGAVFSSHVEAGLIKNNYAAYIEDAKSGNSVEEQQEYYHMAIQLKPGEQEAYLTMLERIIMEDDVLTRDEDEQIRALLIKRSPSGNTYEEELKQNISGYEEFAYKLGLAYYYSYEESGNKALATKWLDIAAQAETLTDGQKERAGRLGKIAQYYAKIGKETKSGDTAISYAAYWEDLVAVTQGDIAKEDNETTALMVYKELVYQIYANAVSFQKAGITYETMHKQLINVSERLDTDITIGQTEAAERRKQMKKNLLENVEQAQKALDNAYGKNI